MSDADKVLSILSELKLQFIECELGFSEEDIKGMSDDEIFEMYDQLAGIEVEETCAAGDNKLTKRGETAAAIVTILGEALYFVEDDG